MSYYDNFSPPPEQVQSQPQMDRDALMIARQQQIDRMNLKTGEIADINNPVERRKLQRRLEKRRQRFKKRQQLAQLAQTNPRAYEEIVQEERSRRNMRNWRKRGYNDETGSMNSTQQVESNDNFDDNEVAASHGFHGYVNHPTKFLMGENGRERVDIHKVRTPKIKKQNSMFGFEFDDLGGNNFNLDKMYKSDMFDFNGKGFGFNGTKTRKGDMNFGFKMEDIFKV